MTERGESVNRKQTVVFAVLASVLLVAALFAGLTLPWFDRKTVPIDIDFSAGPDDGPGGGDYSESLILANRDIVHNAEITPQNVGRLIGTLSRPESYFADMTSRVISGERSAEYHSREWRQGENARTVVTDPQGGEYNYIQNETTVISWKTGDLSYNSMPRGDFSGDSLVRIPTYEELAALGDDDVVSCGVENFQGSECVFAVVSYPEFGYEERYVISIDYGLLLSAETRKSGEIIYQMIVNELSLAEFEGDPFEPPDMPGA